MKQNIEDILRNLDGARDRLSKAKDKRLYSLILIEVRCYMEELEDTITASDLKVKKYADAYNDIFSSRGGISEYDQVCNYIEHQSYSSLYHRIF